MSEKRRDNKGRVLRTGESQRPDGRYEFKFTDLGGNRRTIYSWRLVETDKTPPGKRDMISLREAEAQTLRDIQDGIDRYAAARITLDEYWQSYIDSRYDLRHTSRNQYIYLYRRHVQPTLGMISLASIKYSHIKALYGNLLEHGLKPAVVRSLQAILHPVFSTAVRNGYIRINPTTDVIQELRRTQEWEQGKRTALSEQEQSMFIDFVANSPTFSRYLSMFTVLLGTGVRIGECLGLRWDDLDFSSNIINVTRTLVYSKEPGDIKSTLHLHPPKTKMGNREIPMLAEVRSALLKERLLQMEYGATTDIIDGLTGFVFQTRNKHVLNPRQVYEIITNIIKRHNDIAIKSGIPLLPHFSAHNLRHTFCTRFCENETNIKVIQEIMGHSSAKITMDIYNEATRDKKVTAISNLEGKMKIG